MLFYTVTPKAFTIRNNYERRLLQDLLRQAGLALTPLDPAQIREYILQEEDSSDTDAEDAADSADEEGSEQGPGDQVR